MPPRSPGPLTSVIVPTRDKPVHLRLVAALLDGLEGSDHEVVIVDDGSAVPARSVTDGLLDATHVVLDGRGRAAARNAGAAAAGGELLVFLDDDVLVQPDFVTAHRAAHARRPGATAVHGRLRELPRSRTVLAAVEGRDGSALRDLAAGAWRGDAGRQVANALERTVEAMAAGRLPAVAPWVGFVGANVSVGRDVFEAIGRFDVDFGTGWGCEDLELGLRLERAGVPTVVEPAAPGLHLSHARPGRWEEHREALDRLAAKHPGPAASALAALLGPAPDPDAFVAAYARPVTEGGP